MCMIEDGDVVTILREQTETKARKPHKCAECRRTIAAGETYIHHVYKDDSRAVTDHCCRHCEVARDWLCVFCDGWCYGKVGADLFEHNHDPQALSLAAGIKREWTNDDGTLMSVPQLTKGGIAT